MPDTQIAADTTDLSAFGVGLKLVAAQDVGGRDQDLFDAVLVDDHESAAHVVSVLTEALVERPGSQVLTDQGTPYMAAATRDALDGLGAEHAPQKEGDPCGKSTVERAFETCKSVLRPLLAMTDRIATAVPALHDTALAKAVVTVLLTAMLRAYQAGARAATRAHDARGGLDAEALARAAREHREQARADETSARLLLRHVHELYGITRPLRSFVDSLRRYHPEVLLAAERAFRRQVHRDDIRDRASYFAYLVRQQSEDRRREIGRQRRLREQNALLDQQVATGDTRRPGGSPIPRPGSSTLSARSRRSGGPAPVNCSSAAPVPHPPGCGVPSSDWQSCTAPSSPPTSHAACYTPSASPPSTASALTPSTRSRPSSTATSRPSPHPAPQPPVRPPSRPLSSVVPGKPSAHLGEPWFSLRRPPR